MALALWWLALPGVDLTRMDGRGLLACLPPLWYLALLLALAGPCLLVGLGGVGRRTRSMMMLLGLGALITVLYGTTSALYAVPRQYATYKHIAVVEYLLAGYPLDRSVDIYHNWPGFFLAAAELHRLTGVPVLTLARWSEPCFAAVVALAVMWAVGGAFRASGRDGDARADHAHRVRWGAALVVTTANWVGQNYFSPQAVAFPLALAVIGMLLRMVPTPIGPHLRFTVADRRLRRTTWSDQADVHPFWGGPAGAALCLMAYAAIVVTHQLTPVIVIGQAVALAVMFRQRHAWLPIAFIALEAGWLVQAWGYVSRHFNLLQVDGVENLRPPADGPASTLAWAKELTWASPAMMMLLFVLTAIALLLLGRRAVTSPADRWVIAPALFGLVPVSVVLVQPYGNEGIFRAFLFALPWAALLVVPVVLLRDGRRPPRLGAGGVRLVLPVLLAALWLPASFAPELDSYVYPSDVRTAMWTATGTPSRSALMRVAGGSPIPMSADYAHRKFEWETLNTPVTDWPGFTDTVSGGAASMAGYVGQAASWYPVDDVYLVLGPGQAAHVRYHGDLGSASWADLVAAIAAEGSFELIHTDGDSSVWRYRGTTQSATS